MTDTYEKINDDTLEATSKRTITKADLEKAKVFYEKNIADAEAKLVLVNEKLELLK